MVVRGASPQPREVVGPGEGEEARSQQSGEVHQERLE